ncbi:MAG: hypothetical protein ACFFCL_08775 [Promethearchaeota archaeon]
MVSDAELKQYMKILVIIGGIVGIIECIAGFTGYYGFWGFRIVWPIIGLILSVLLLLTVYKPDTPLPYNPIVILVLGILMLIISTAHIGGILTIIAGILGILAKA